MITLNDAESIGELDGATYYRVRVVVRQDTDGQLHQLGSEAAWAETLEARLITALARAAAAEQRATMAEAAFTMERGFRRHAEGELAELQARAVLLPPPFELLAAAAPPPAPAAEPAPEPAPPAAHEAAPPAPPPLPFEPVAGDVDAGEPAAGELDEAPAPLHICVRCGADFDDAAALGHHMATKHGPWPRPCPYCHKDIRNATGWSAHVRTMHPEESREPPPPAGAQDLLPSEAAALSIELGAAARRPRRISILHALERDPGLLIPATDEEPTDAAELLRRSPATAVLAQGVLPPARWACADCGSTTGAPSVNDDTICSVCAARRARQGARRVS